MAAAKPTTAPARTSMLSGPVDAAVDVRRACNGIKRMTSMTVATLASGWNPEEVLEVATSMAVAVLNNIGFDMTDEHRVEGVLPMVLEACSYVLADAAKHVQPDDGIPELRDAALRCVSTLTEVAKSRAVARMVEPEYPTDIDSMVALRLSAATAMANVAVEVYAFDFLHPAEACIKEAGKHVVKAAVEAANLMAPASASNAARLMLTQSLVHSASRIYAAMWRVEAGYQADQLDAMTPEAREARLIEMERTALPTLMAPINDGFHSSFGAIADASLDLAGGVKYKKEDLAAPVVRKAASPR